MPLSVCGFGQVQVKRAGQVKFLGTQVFPGKAHTTKKCSTGRSIAASSEIGSNKVGPKASTSTEPFAFGFKAESFAFGFKAGAVKEINPPGTVSACTKINSFKAG
jgi:hypothetical protein